MIYLDLPFGNNYGWGICGKYITKELASMTDICLVREESALSGMDPLELPFFKQFLIAPELLSQVKNGILTKVDFPLLQAISYCFPSWSKMSWLLPKPRGSFTAGYIFFDEDNFDPDYIKYLDENWDLMIAGSSWCEEVLRQHGLKRLMTIIQGVDPRIFNPSELDKEYFKDRFVIFSGGKFEYRKGQDVVIKAYKILQDKYKDVMLLNAWYNHWPGLMQSMELSSHIVFNFPPRSNKWNEVVNGILVDNGIDIERVITLPAYSNVIMAKMYKNSDVGLFTNRREGGTNLVLMEYMACSKPVIASYNSGHKDVLTEKNSLMTKSMIPRKIKFKDDLVVATWEEPDLDETVSHLEWAYHNRDKLKLLGIQGGVDMGQNSWHKVAEQFYRVLQSGCTVAAE